MSRTIKRGPPPKRPAPRRKVAVKKVSAMDRLVGGYLADQYLGSKRAVKFGAIIMALETALGRVSMLVGERIDWSVIESFLPDGGERLRRSALASSFVAALELARRGRIDLRQASPFAPLYLRATKASA